MTAHFIAILFIAWFVCERLFTRRSRPGNTLRDRGSAILIVSVQFACIFLGIEAAFRFPDCLFPALPVVRVCGFCIYVLGFFLRFYSIFYLGRFFTTNVTIAADHRVVDSGPYRFIRHPSYTGTFMLYLGICLCIGNWATTLIIIVPVFCAFLWRMKVEETALREALGEPYADYMKRTKRLIPMVY
jgi:protein-S-isoprenylcysteine O-methyltransferase Ste14